MEIKGRDERRLELFGGYCDSLIGTIDAVTNRVKYIKSAEDLAEDFGSVEGFIEEVKEAMNASNYAFHNADAVNVECATIYFFEEFSSKDWVVDVIVKNLLKEVCEELNGGYSDSVEDTLNERLDLLDIDDRGELADWASSHLKGALASDWGTIKEALINRLAEYIFTK